MARESRWWESYRSPAEYPFVDLDAHIAHAGQSILKYLPLKANWHFEKWSTRI